MPYEFGRGGSFGHGGGMGFGFRGSSPPWPYVGRGRGGLPRCGYYFRPGAAPLHPPYSPGMTREEELSYMKDQADAIKRQLEEIESRMRDLEGEEKQ
jgi:hypothetical protein